MPFRLAVAAALIVALPGFADAQGRPEASAETSEERPPALCPPGTSIAGVTCSGRFCDNVGVVCRQRGLSVIGGAGFGRWFSEEQKRLQLCPENQVLAGLACRGSYCDELALYCVNSRPIDRRDCLETITVSEEDPGYLMFPDDFAPIGMRCYGSNCDNKSFLVCRKP